MITKEDVQTLILSGELVLGCSQDKLCIPIVNRLYIKMISGLSFTAIKVVDNLICNGHHRYIASCLAGISIGIDPYVITNATEKKNWELVHLDENDWESEDDINIHNQKDAEVNNMKMSELQDLLSNKAKKV
ncbi:MAG TPA: hypothetical protein VM802_21520 [Chitinophaga sp.]|uniref:hypothetical protein n=1 Tax=Chitinophaga sp. TaxID=1869181 RepID=UPI002C472AE5|nr:hypothetical protein [Chitinophaga sp.]HVI47467.1 hypothetical protein [Chitinophaga sp.]